ncbi:gluconate 2-dehydrogenase subunit 3 family protein [Luteolibacter algae]|uniref:Gluconate 2-dehydrogenase subunit 3 family protein n=1 Tax=Luteolibacter algae TaxID=454151 RepID=A0ABW5DAJ1_9BACT
MDRRELLKAMAMTVGGSLALPESVFARMGEPFDQTQLTFFTPEQRQHAAALAEAIIPETDTPGAIEAGVPGWIEVIVKDCLQPSDQKVIAEGLVDFAQRCQKQYGKSIDQLPAEEQVKFLTELHTSQLQERKNAIRNGLKPRNSFLQQFKELTKFCYVNSELGATKAFEFVFVPTKWVASMPLEPGQKAYSM